MARKWILTSTSLTLSVLMVVCSYYVSEVDAQSGSVGGCYYYCCDYSCGGYCCGTGWYCYSCCCGNTCYYFIPYVGSSYYWAGCSGESVTQVGAGVVAQLYSGSYANAYIQGSSSTLQVVSGASLSNGYLQAPSSAASITGYVGTLSTSTSPVSIYVAPGGQVGTIAASASSATINIYGQVTSSSSGGGVTYVQGGASVGTHCQYGGSVTVIGTVSYLCGYGTFVITGAVTTLSTSGSSVVSVVNGASLTNMYLNGPSSTVSINNEYISNIYIQYAGSSTTMSMFNAGSGFGNLIATGVVNGLTLQMVSSTPVGCVVFQQAASNVLLSYYATYFSSSSCHFVQFQGAATSTTISVLASAQTYVTNYAAVKADSTVNGMYIYWSDSRITTNGYDAFRFLSVIGSGLTITTDALYSCISCNMIIGNDRYKRLDAGLSVVNIQNGNSAGSNIQITTTSSTWSAYGGHAFQCTGAAYSVTMTMRGSSLNYGNGHSAYFSSSVTGLAITLNNAGFYAGSGTCLYIAGNLNTAQIYLYNTGNFQATTHGVYIGGTTASASVTVSDSGSTIYAKNGHSCAFALAASSISITITNTGSLQSSFGNNVLFGNTATNVLITLVSNGLLTTTGQHNVWVVSTSTNFKVGLYSDALIQTTSSSSYHNVYFQGAATTTTLLADQSSTFSAYGNNLCANGVTQNLVMYVTSSSTITSSQAENWRFTSSSSLSNAVDTTQTNVLSISGQSLMLSQTDNFWFQGSASLSVSIIGASSASQVTVSSTAASNFHFATTVQWVQITITQSVLSTSGTQNVLAQGIIGSVSGVQPPSWILMTTSTITSPKTATGMEFQGARKSFTITASGNCIWTAGNVGAISMTGASTGDVIRIVSSVVVISTASTIPSILQLNSGTSSTMNGASISMSAVAYTFTEATPIPSTLTMVSFVRTNNNVFASSTVLTVFGCSFTVVATNTHRMEILDMQAATMIYGGNILIAKIPYYSSTSCSTLPKGYGPCAALKRGAITIDATTGTISGTTITVQCIEFSTTSLNFIYLGGTILNTLVRTDSVAIWQSQDIVALINFDNVASSGNQVMIVQTYIHMPIIVHSTAGAVGVSNGISAQCSFMSQYPMSAGFFEPLLVALVARPPLPTCPKVFAPSCWITKSASLSLTVTLSLTLSLSLSSTVTLSEEMTMSTTRTVSMTVSLARMTGTVTYSEDMTKSLSLHPTRSHVISPSKTLVLSLTNTIPAATGTKDHRKSRTLSFSSIPTLSWSESIGTRSPSHSSTLTVTYSLSDSITDSISHSLSDSPTLSQSPSVSRDTEEQSRSSSSSQSGTFSDSGTQEQTLSESLTISQPPPTVSESETSSQTTTFGTMTPDETISLSSSSSASSSATHSPSPSGSLSSEESQSPTVTLTDEPTVSETISDSITSSLSQAQSVSQYSPTDTLTESPSLSKDASATIQSESGTATGEPTITKSKSLSRDITESFFSPSRELSVSQSPSNSSAMSPSVTETWTDTPSTSPTPTMGTNTELRTQSLTDTISGSLSPTDSASSSGSKEYSNTVTMSVSSDPATNEVTLSETQTVSTTVSWSGVVSSATQQNTRSRTRATISPAISASETTSLTHASFSMQLSDEISHSGESSTISRTSSSSLSFDHGSVSSTSSQSLTFDGNTASDSVEASATKSRTPPRNSLSVVAIPSATLSDWLTMTLSSTASKNHRLTRSVLRLSKSMSATDDPSLTLRSASLSFSILRRRGAGHGPLGGRSWSATLSPSAELAVYTISATVSQSSSGTDVTVTVPPARHLVDGGMAGGRNVTDTLAKLSETRQLRRKRSASLSLSLLIRVSASPVHTPTRWNVALSRSKTVTVSDITHARHNDGVVGAGGEVGATLSVSGLPRTSETSHSSSSSAGLWSNTHTISASLLTITRKRTKSQRKLTEQYSMSVSRTRRRGGMSDTVTETDEFTWKVSESSTKMTKSASKSSTLMGRSRSLSTTVTGPTHSTVLPSHTPTRVIGLHAAGHSHSLSQGALTSTVSLTIASRTRSYSKKRGGGGGGGGEWMMWLSTTVSVTPSLSQSRSGRRYRNNGGAWGDGGERTHSALEWSLTISTTAMLTVTPTLTPTYPHHVNASASSTLLVITDTLSRLKPTISDASLSTTATVTDGESETLWTETLTKKSATLTCERPRTATPTFVHTPTSHRDRLLGGGEHWRLGSASDSQTTTLVSTLTESVSLSNTTPKPLYQEPSGGGNLGAAALTGGMLPMVGGVSLSGVPLALVLVNLVVGAVSLVSMLMFASGMRRRKKKKPDQATTTPPSTLQVDSRTSLQVEEQPNEVVGTSAGDDSDDVMIFSHPLDETEKHHSAALVSTGSNITVKFQHLTTYVAPFGRHDDVDDIEEDDDILSMNNVDERLRGRDDVEVDPIQLQIADIPNEPSTTSQLQEEGTPVKDLQPSSAPSTSVSVGGVLPLSDNDGADDTLPPTRSLFWDAVRFHTYAGVLFPCSDACGWSHAAASCVHSNLTMLLASLIGLYTSPVSSGSAFAVGLVAPPLVLGLIRWLVVEPLALPCLHNSCDTSSAEPNETTLAWPPRSALSAEEELGPEHKYLAAFHSTEGIITNSSEDGSDDNLPEEQVAHPQEQNPQWSPTFAPGSSQRSLRTLDAIDLNLHRTSFAASGMWSSISGGDVVDNDHDFFVDAEGEEDTQSDFNDVVDLDALALPPLAPSPKSQFTTATGRRQSKGPTLSPLDLCSDRSPPPRSAAPKMEEGGGGGDAFDMDIDVMSLDNMMPLPTPLRSMLVGTDNKLAPPPPYNSLQADGREPGTTLLHVDADDNFNVVSNAFDFGEEGESSAATANIRAGVPFYVPRGKPTTHDDEHSFHRSRGETWFADGDFSKLPTVLSGRYRRKMARGEHVSIDGDEKGEYDHDDDDDVRFFDDSRRMEHQLGDSGINNARRGSAVLEQSYVDDDEAEMTADMLLMNAIHASVATTANIVERPPSVTNRKAKPLKRSQTTTITSAASVEDDPLQDNFIQTEWIPLDMSRNATTAARDYDDNPMTEPLVAANRSRGGDSPPPVSSLPRHHVDVPRRSLSHCRSSSAWTDADPLAHGSTPSTKLDFASPLSGASVVQISRQVGTTATADCTANGSNSFVGDQSSRPLSFSSERQTDRVPEDSSKVQQETYSQETPTLVSAAPHRQRVTIVLLLVSAVVIVLVLLFGIRNYNSSTVSIMCGAFVGDAVFGQPLRIAVVRRLLRSAA